MMYMDSQRLEMGKVRVVVNRYQKDAGLQTAYLKEAFDGDVFHTIPSEPDAVQKSLMDGKPIHSGTVIGKSMAAMASRLVEKRETDGKKGSKSGLLSSFFR
jgi:CO dehydrogenase nickel-insertion accessory protein CooC1